MADDYWGIYCKYIAENFAGCLFSRYEFPNLLKEWLSYIAPAVLGALTALSVMAPKGFIDISLDNFYIWAFIPTIIVAVKTRSLLHCL